MVNFDEPMMSDVELVAGALLDAQRDGDQAGMRQIVHHASPQLRQAVTDLLIDSLIELAARGNAAAGRVVARFAEQDRVAMLLARASVSSRLDQVNATLRHQVVHPLSPVDTALRWELGDRVSNALQLG